MVTDDDESFAGCTIVDAGHNQFFKVGSDANDEPRGGVWLSMCLYTDEHAGSVHFKTPAHARELARVLELKADEVELGEAKADSLANPNRTANLFKALWLDSEREHKKTLLKLAHGIGSAREMESDDAFAALFELLDEILEDYGLSL